LGNAQVSTTMRSIERKDETVLSLLHPTKLTKYKQVEASLIEHITYLE